MRIKKLKYKGRRALQSFLLCLFSFFLMTTAYAQSNRTESTLMSQSDIELMAKAARDEGLDKSETFQQILNAFRQELAGKYLFDEQSATLIANDTFGKITAKKGDKQLLIRQIFHSLPQHVMNNEQVKWQQRMDSISKALANGADFEALMIRYSETSTAVWMRRLDMTDEMEQVAFALRKGQISQPFLSPLGFHIIQVIDERQEDNEAYVAAYVQRIKEKVYPNREIAQQINKLKQTYSFTENRQAVNRLYREGKVSGTLFTLGGKDFTGEQFARFAHAYPLNVRLQYEAFVTKSVLDCEVNHLDEHPDYKQSVQDLANKLLAQEAYNKHVRMPSQTDEFGLQTYFSTHQKDYRWSTPKFRGAVIHAADKKTAKKVRKIVKKLRNVEWEEAERLLDDKTRRKVFIEQGDYVIGVNAFVDELEFKKGKATPMQGYPVALTVGKKVNGPDDYREVMDQLVQDYERYLSERWLSDLRKQK